MIYWYGLCRVTKCKVIFPIGKSCKSIHFRPVIVHVKEMKRVIYQISDEIASLSTTIASHW